MSLPAPARSSAREEVANTLTHAFGALLALAGAGLLLPTLLHGSRAQQVGCAVFAFSLVLLYLVSALYHALRQGRAKTVLRALDHSAIFLLIAGTYTPFTLVSLRGAWGWSLFAVVWTLAVGGIVMRLLLRERARAFFVGLYLAMGWCAAAALGPLTRALGASGMALLVAGGLAYSLGVVFYASPRPYCHAIWHGFVLAGSVFHYAAVLLYVAALN